MRVGWLADDHTPPGGAELAAAALRAAAPCDVIECPPGNVTPGLDRYVVHNCVNYKPADLEPIGAAPIVKYLHDRWPHGDVDVRTALLARARLIFSSPLHRDRYPWPNPGGALIPPPLEFCEAPEAERRGTVCIGTYLGPGKGGHLIDEWAVRHGPVDFYGWGAHAPRKVNDKGPLRHSDIPAVLARYERFVHLPVALEPFGLAVAEAWVAGCELVTNRNVGCLWWIENNPEALHTAAEDFWAEVLRD